MSDDRIQTTGDDTVPEAPHRPLWRRLASIAVTVAVIVVVFGFVIPQLADYREILDHISSIDPMEWVILGALALWFLTAATFTWMTTLPTLRFGEGFVAQTTGTAINNSIPGGGAIAVPVQYIMFLSWGFTPGAVTSGLLTAGVWDQLVRFALPVLAVFAVAVTGDAVAWMWVVSIAGVLVVAGAVWILRTILGSESAARRVGELLDRVVNKVLGWLGRPPIDMVSAMLQFSVNVTTVAGERWKLITLATVLNQASMASLFLASLRAVGVPSDEVSAAWVILSFSLGRFLVIIPVSPGGLGLVDLGYIGLLTLGWGTGADAALLAAGVLLFRALSFIPPIFSGLGSWVFWRWNRSWRQDWQVARRGEVTGRI